MSIGTFHQDYYIPSATDYPLATQPLLTADFTAIPQEHKEELE